MKRFSVLLMLSVTMALAVVSAGAAQPEQSGLVNVAVVDNTVQIPIGVAANVCGVAVNILASATVTAPVDCTAVAGAEATGPAGGGGGGSDGSQSGLINLYVADNTVQVPVAVAANICGVAANVLAQGIATGPVSCDAEGNADADA
jgi:hypothetical protein